MNQSNQEKYNITYEHIEENIREKLCQEDEKIALS